MAKFIRQIDLDLFTWKFNPMIDHITSTNVLYWNKNIQNLYSTNEKVLANKKIVKGNFSLSRKARY